MIIEEATISKIATKSLFKVTADTDVLERNFELILKALKNQGSALGALSKKFDGLSSTVDHLSQKDSQQERMNSESNSNLSGLQASLN